MSLLRILYKMRYINKINIKFTNNMVTCTVDFLLNTKRKGIFLKIFFLPCTTLREEF